MDFFGFNTNAAADFSSPVGMLIKAATDPTLDSPDWGRLVTSRCTHDPHKVLYNLGLFLHLLTLLEHDIICVYFGYQSLLSAFCLSNLITPFSLHMFLI
jgi:hypothetical protein